MLICSAGNAWGVVGWSIGNGWCVSQSSIILLPKLDTRLRTLQTLLLPTVFDALGPNTLHLFGAVNILSIVVVWALYPETNQRTLEEMNLVFAADSMSNKLGRESDTLANPSTHCRYLELGRRKELQDSDGGEPRPCPGGEAWKQCGRS